MADAEGLLGKCQLSLGTDMRCTVLRKRILQAGSDGAGTLEAEVVGVAAADAAINIIKLFSL